MKTTAVALFAALVVLTFFAQPGSTSPDATELIVISWNVESGGADPAVIAERIAAFDGIDLWGLSEVNDADAGQTFAVAAEDGEGADFEGILGTTGGGDRLLAIYDTARFEYLGHEELEHINVGGNVRAPLVVHLRDRESEVEFLFMVNHLYRTNDDARHTQASLLNEWAGAQTLPVVSIGDFNFDWSVTNGDVDHDLGYDNLTALDRWEWVRPPTLVTTQCSGWPCAFNSVLDFVFVAGPAQAWDATSGIVVVDGDFPDDDATSDHRPVRAVFQLTDEDPATVTPAAAFLYLPSVIRFVVTPQPTPQPTQQPTQEPTPQPTVEPSPTVTQEPPGPCPCEANTLNCSDFSTQPEAQACYDHCVSIGRGDIHRLDGSDNDGLACETLPGGFTVIR